MTKVKNKKRLTNRAGEAITRVDRGVGMPKELRIRLRAVTATNLNHAGSIQTSGYGCNLPYNPFQTFSTTDQPSYVLWLQQAYQNYYTVKSHIRVELINSTVADSIMVALGKDGNLTGTHTLNEISEQHGAVSGAVGYYSGGSNRLVLESSFYPRADIGIPPDGASNVGVTGSDPSDKYYWILGLIALAGGTGNVALKVSLEYDVVFSQLESPCPA